MKKIFTSCLLSASLALASQHAAATTTLRLAHIWPASSVYSSQIFEAWAKAVEKESGGELKINIYPSQTLVKANKSYEGTVNGITDISANVQGYTAGRFPLTEILELPGLTNNAQQGACIAQKLYEDGHISSEYQDTHVLFMFSTGPAYLHTRTKEIRKVTDLEGLRIRRPSEVTGELLALMGASPVGMPAPDIYQALQRGVVDGLSFPFEAMKGFRINELTKYHLLIPYASTEFVMTMNKNVYNALSPKLKKVIDDNSGMKWAMKAGEVFNKLDTEGLEQAKSQGDVIHSVPDPLNSPSWGPLLKKGTENYLKRVEAHGGTTAHDVYNAALKMRDECSF